MSHFLSPSLSPEEQSRWLEQVKLAPYCSFDVETTGLTPNSTPLSEKRFGRDVEYCDNANELHQQCLAHLPKGVNPTLYDFLLQKTHLRQRIITVAWRTEGRLVCFGLDMDEHLIHCALTQDFTFLRELLLSIHNQSMWGLNLGFDVYWLRFVLKNLGVKSLPYPKIYDLMLLARLIWPQVVLLYQQRYAFLQANPELPNFAAQYELVQSFLLSKTDKSMAQGGRDGPSGYSLAHLIYLVNTTLRDKTYQKPHNWVEQTLTPEHHAYAMDDAIDAIVIAESMLGGLGHRIGLWEASPTPEQANQQMEQDPLFYRLPDELNIQTAYVSLRESSENLYVDQVWESNSIKKLLRHIEDQVADVVLMREKGLPWSLERQIKYCDDLEVKMRDIASKIIHNFDLVAAYERQLKYAWAKRVTAEYKAQIALHEELLSDDEQLIPFVWGKTSVIHATQDKPASIRMLRPRKYPLFKFKIQNYESPPDLEKALEDMLVDVNKGISQELKLAVADLFDQAGLELSYTETGLPQVGTKDLRRMKAAKNVNTQVLFKLWSNLFAYKKAHGMARQFSGFVADNGRIHSLLSHGPITGRLSSAEPNNQQMPRDPNFRGLVQAKPGYCIVASDFSALDMRVGAALAIRCQQRIERFIQNKDLIAPCEWREAAHALLSDVVSQSYPIEHWHNQMVLAQQVQNNEADGWHNKKLTRMAYLYAVVRQKCKEAGSDTWGSLRDAFQIPDMDIHTWTALGMDGRDPVKILSLVEKDQYGQKLHELKKELGSKRDRGKVGNLSLLYYMQAKGLQAAAAKNYDTHWSIEEAQQVITQWDATYPEIELWQIWSSLQNNLSPHAKISVPVFNSYTKKRRQGQLKSYASDTLAGRRIYSFSHNAALSYEDQSTGADIMALTMRYLRQHHREVFDHLILQVHDEMVAEFPIAKAREYTDILAKAMVASANEFTCTNLGLNVPCEVSPATDVFWVKEDNTDLPPLHERAQLRPYWQAIPSDADAQWAKSHMKAKQQFLLETSDITEVMAKTSPKARVKTLSFNLTGEKPTLAPKAMPSQQAEQLLHPVQKTEKPPLSRPVKFVRMDVTVRPEPTWETFYEQLLEALNAEGSSLLKTLKQAQWRTQIEQATQAALPWKILKKVQDEMRAAYPDMHAPIESAIRRCLSALVDRPVLKDFSGCSFYRGNILSETTMEPPKPEVSRKEEAAPIVVHSDEPELF